jgi:hypothetical protein
MTNPMMALPRRDLAVFLAYTFFILSIGFAAGWFVAKYFW